MRKTCTLNNRRYLGQRGRQWKKRIPRAERLVGRHCNGETLSGASPDQISNACQTAAPECTASRESTRCRNWRLNAAPWRTVTPSLTHAKNGDSALEIERSRGWNRLRRARAPTYRQHSMARPLSSNTLNGWHGFGRVESRALCRTRCSPLPRLKSRIVIHQGTRWDFLKKNTPSIYPYFITQNALGVYL